MAIIKYYRLESRAKDAVDSLTPILQKRLLSERAIAGLLSSHIEDTIEAEAKAISREEREQALHETEEFQTLYRQSSTISEGKRKLFGRNIPPKYGIELVVKGTASDIMMLQGDLADPEFEVIEAKTVSKATYSFSTPPLYPPAEAEAIRRQIRDLLKREDNGLEYTIDGFDGYNDRSFGVCRGFLQGEPEQVLRLRNVVNGIIQRPVKTNLQFY